MVILFRIEDLLYFCRVKYLYITLGTVSLGLGIVGIVLPLLPTTPFLLLTAALYLKSSPRLYAWLMSRKYLGTYIRNFRENKAIPFHGKIIAITLIWITHLYCVFYILDHWWWAQLFMLLLAITITCHLLSFKTIKR